MHFGFMNVILLHSDHGHVLATHVAIFRVVRARVYTCLLYVRITPQFKIIQFWLQFLLKGKIVTSTKHKNLKTVVWSVVLWVMYTDGACGSVGDVHRQCMWCNVNQLSEQ
jgi:hypothetical protein